ncbi:hypothetical protein EZS27_023385 [termite gut metagenome]|uniref:Uncharacterized protein n=1 Tax=termite gut metagenome TaxID=433724 RepID=A0A5J4R1Q5_9ZZZZ
MELLFNELSIEPLCADPYQANDRMKQFAETVSTARKRGFKRIRSHYDSNQIKLAENYSLYDWLHNKNVPKIYRDLFYGMITCPFIKDGDEVIEKQYVEANYYFEDKDNDIAKTECIGLASAYLYETLSISLSSSAVWDKLTLSIIIEQAGKPTSVEKVFNVSSKESFGDDRIAKFIESLNKEIILITTTIPPDEKQIHLANHHGKAELQGSCDRLKHSPYVIEMRSTDWGGNQFIRKVQKDGSIEIVLTKTQRQYALWVQTTGRNYRETKEIAEKLKEKFT